MRRPISEQPLRTVGVVGLLFVLAATALADEASPRWATVTFAAIEQAMALTATEDGGCVVVGTSRTGPTEDFVLERFAADGTPSRWFGAAGVARTDFASGPDQADAVGRHHAQSQRKEE